MQRLLILATLLLTACATTPPPAPVVVTRDVPVAVVTPCSPRLQPEPAYPDGDAALRAEPDILALVTDLRAGRAMRIGRIAELEGALASCRAPG